MLCDCCKKRIPLADRLDSICRQNTLTPIQRAVVLAVLEHRAEHGVSPTLDELGASFGRSKVTVREHVLALVKKGVMKYGAKESRSIRVVETEGMR